MNVWIPKKIQIFETIRIFFPCNVLWLRNKLALCLYKSELCFKVIERKYNMAAYENFGHWFDYHKQKNYAKV